MPYPTSYPFTCRVDKRSRKKMAEFIANFPRHSDGPYGGLYKADYALNVRLSHLGISDPQLYERAQAAVSDMLTCDFSPVAFEVCRAIGKENEALYNTYGVRIFWVGRSMGWFAIKPTTGNSIDKDPDTAATWDFEILKFMSCLLEDFTAATDRCRDAFIRAVENWY